MSSTEKTKEIGSMYNEINSDSEYETPEENFEEENPAKTRAAKVKKKGFSKLLGEGERFNQKCAGAVKKKNTRTRAGGRRFVHNEEQIETLDTGTFKMMSEFMEYSDILVSREKSNDMPKLAQAEATALEIEEVEFLGISSSSTRSQKKLARETVADIRKDEDTDFDSEQSKEMLDESIIFLAEGKPSKEPAEMIDLVSLKSAVTDVDSDYASAQSSVGLLEKLINLLSECYSSHDSTKGTDLTSLKKAHNHSKNYEEILEDLAQITDLESSREEVIEIPYLQCQCCFDEIPCDESIECGKKLHTFCKNCVIKSCEVAIGDGNCFVKCMAAVDCTEVFPNATLAPVLPPQVFQKMEELQQIAEVAKAKIEGLENCPFCEFAYVPHDGTVFQCMKQGCLKASCRLCKQDSHVPLRCDEVVKEQDVRQKIENAMTEKLLRQCYQCGKKYVKQDGCNKIVCPCGAKMCYLCQQPVTDYKHFNGPGGIENEKCPLWTDNDVLHVEEVRNAGIRARDEALAKAPNLELSYDPTRLLNPTASPPGASRMYLRRRD